MAKRPKKYSSGEGKEPETRIEEPAVAYLPEPAEQVTVRVGKRGTVVLPARLRRQLGIDDDTLLVAEELAGGILLRPAVAVPVGGPLPEELRIALEAGQGEESMDLSFTAIGDSGRTDISERAEELLAKGFGK